MVFAFFGYNESFAGEAGLEKFKADLASFIKHTTGQKYNGKSNARVVLFSPVAHENLKDPNLPDGTANNKRLELYTAAMLAYFLLCFPVARGVDRIYRRLAHLGSS